MPGGNCGRLTRCCQERREEEDGDGETKLDNCLSVNSRGGKSDDPVRPELVYLFLYIGQFYRTTNEQ